ncbi:MAG: amidohydrolase family protein [Alcaligenaceae bacterium]|jgi:N-acyl-D-aspartate/D-glutamate deacylase
MFDLIIRNAQVFDGLGHPALRADVAVSQGVVAEIGKISGSAKQEIDAKGLSLMPGIVDLHTHFDAQVTWDRTMSPSPALGVTTVVMGNCGFGIAPCPAPQRETMVKNLSVVEGMDLTSLLTGVNWQFESFKEYMDQLRSIKPYLNTAVFVGHSVVRTAVMGDAGSEKAEPSKEELDAMCQLVREAMAAGSIGFASSFSPNHSGYAGRPMPSTIASEAELMALTGVMGEFNKGVFMMATGSRATPEVMENVTINSGRPSFISTVLSMYNPANPDLAITYYDKAAEMRARGHEVYILTSCQPLSFDFTLAEPYPLISHSAFDAIKGQSKDEIKKIYATSSFRNAFRDNLKNPKTGILFLGDWKYLEVGETQLAEHDGLEGLTIEALGKKWGKDPLDAFFDLSIKEDLQTHFTGKFFNHIDDGVAPLVKHPSAVVTLSDAGAHLIYMCDAAFGLYFLSHWVRETGHFSLEEGIRRITSEAADRFKIPNRGRLLVGSPADMLLFDPTTIGMTKVETLNDLPGGGSRKVRAGNGIHGVWVNGTLVHDGKDYVELEQGPGHVLDRFDH